MGKVYIYGLKDPRDGNIYYVGQSVKPKRRLKAHLRDRKTNLQKAKWIDGLRKSGLIPELVILQKVEEDCNRNRAEMRWIKRGLNMGWPLTNGCAGGDESGINCLVPFIKPDLLEAFYSLSDKEQIAIGAEAARAGLPYVVMILRQWRTRPADIELKDAGYFAASEVANKLISRSL